MISQINPAFELLRKYKKVEPDTETLVLKRIRGRLSHDELITIFEKGVAGEYGKFVVADPQTILSWVQQYEAQKSDSKNYIHSELLDPNTHIASHNYPQKSEEWHKEANKCFNAFINGVDAIHFHPHVYDRMMLDGKISHNAYLKHYSGLEEVEVIKAKQTILKETFQEYRKKGWKTVYIVV